MYVLMELCPIKRGQELITLTHCAVGTPQHNQRSEKVIEVTQCGKLG